jgi:hypothetical protein
VCAVSQVLLVSTRAGGTGLNLTEAANAFMMDCWWNAAVDEQAMDRVHRLGQMRPVTVIRCRACNGRVHRWLACWLRGAVVLCHLCGTSVFTFDSDIVRAPLLAYSQPPPSPPPPPSITQGCLQHRGAIHCQTGERLHQTLPGSVGKELCRRCQCATHFLLHPTHTPFSTRKACNVL